MGDLTERLNAWSQGAWAPLWVWLGSSAAGPWLGVLVVLVICTRVYLSVRVAKGRAATLDGILRRAASALLAAALAVAISDPLCSRVLKPLFAEPRPCQIGVTEVPPPLPCGSGMSMPSSHASNSGAVAAAIQSPVLAVVAGLIGVSRVVDGQHWPGDILAGWSVGAFLGITMRRLTDRILKTG